MTTDSKEAAVCNHRGTTNPELAPDETNNQETTSAEDILTLATIKMKTTNISNNNNKRRQQSIRKRNNTEAQTNQPPEQNVNQNAKQIEELYRNNKVQLSKKGTGLLDIYAT